MAHGHDPVANADKASVLLEVALLFPSWQTPCLAGGNSRLPASVVEARAQPARILPLYTGTQSVGSRLLEIFDQSPGCRCLAGRAKIRQQESAVDRLRVHDRDAMGPVITSKRLEFVGSAKRADWGESLTGPCGRLSNLT
jgi:hypothetical protein